MIVFLGYLLAGAFAWTFTEYCVHRWLGHDRRFTQNFFGIEHTAHHSKGNYFAPAWKKIATAFLVVGMILPPIYLILGWAKALSFVLGFVGFYLYYETLHWLEHVHQGFGPVGRWLRRYHFHHHFHAPDKNHGVTSPLWDWVFGTFVKPGVVRVPERLQMVWLCDPHTDQVRDHLRNFYELRSLARQDVAEKCAP